MTVQVLDTTSGLNALAAEWRDLWERTPDATPFQSPHWLLPWWRAFGTPHPRVGILREGGALVGVLPAYLLDEPGGRKLLPIGAGTTDYLDLLGQGSEPLLHTLLDRAAGEGVAVCDLIETPPGSPLRAVPPPPGWRATWSEGETCPVLRLSEIPSGIRRKLRMSRHRADRVGGWLVEQASRATLEASLEALITLHRSRWAAGGEPGVLADPLVTQFHRDAAIGLLEAGLSRLTVLHVGDRVAAAILALLAPGRVFFYLSGYDTEQHFVSPGTILLGAMLDEAAAEGRTEAHFLRGREAYKYAWGAQDRRNATGHFERR